MAVGRRFSRRRRRPRPYLTRRPCRRQAKRCSLEILLDRILSVLLCVPFSSPLVVAATHLSLVSINVLFLTFRRIPFLLLSYISVESVNNPTRAHCMGEEPAHHYDIITDRLPRNCSTRSDHWTSQPVRSSRITSYTQRVLQLLELHLRLLLECNLVS
jgi:hypothetical protein